MPAPHLRRAALPSPTNVAGDSAAGREFATTGCGEIAEVLACLRRFARTEEPVVILGETGTGKSHLAHYVHAHSRRARGPFKEVNLAGIDDGLASAELFGCIPGAYTDAKERRAGALADASGGTVLLDEVGKASVAIQRKLLDLLQRRSFRPLGSDREVRLNARLVFAANESLHSLVASGAMLREFEARLGLLRVEVPPLRKRRKDIPIILHALIKECAPSFGYPPDEPPHPSAELVAALVRLDWPNNTRGLDSLIRRLLADLEGGPVIELALLTDDLRRFAECGRHGRESRCTCEEVVDEIARCRGNKSRAARGLGISRTSVYRIAKLFKALGEGAAGFPEAS